MLSGVNQNRAWQPSTPQRRVDDATRQMADSEATRIPWPQLLKARRSYVKWQEFQQWVRAIEESERRSPQPVWYHLEQWIHERIFAKPWREGWMNAAGYYAVRDLAALRNEAYWYYCEPQWQRSRPAAYPSIQEWRKDSEHCSDEVVDHFETTNELLDLIRLSRRISLRTLNETVDRYVEAGGFAILRLNNVSSGRSALTVRTARTQHEWLF
jgi:hypothetical protein